MFGLMKNLLKDKETTVDAVKLAELHVGCSVGFGFMPQKNISGRRLPVTEVNSYLFDADSFVAFRLESDSTDVNLIVADGENTTGAYLALSRRLKERFFAPLFVSPLPDGWFDMNEGQTIDVAARVLGAPQGWLASRYALAMKTRGRILAGDFRMRKPADRQSLSRPFDYVLLVDESNEHALEAERYEDGTLNVYATVYRPVSDIGELALAPRQNKALPLISEKEMLTKEVTPELPAAVQETTIQEVAKETTIPAIDIAPRPFLGGADITPIHGKFGRIQPIVAATPEPVGETLAFDTRLAGRIIDEAQRNQMLLSELIRKVIDLPARIHEEVLVPFSLEPAEYAELARRYDLPASDREAVRQKILEELRQFVGEKKK